jgi:excisionase family DNA binding protein
MQNLKLLSVREVAQILSVKPQTIWSWRLQNKFIPAVKVGRCVRFKLSDIEKFIIENQEKLNEK